MANATPRQVREAIAASIKADLVTSQDLIDDVFEYIKADLGSLISLICITTRSTNVEKLTASGWDQPYQFDIILFVKRGDPSKTTGYTEEAAEDKLNDCQNAILEWIKANTANQALWRDLSQVGLAEVMPVKDVNAKNYFGQAFTVNVIA